MFEKELDRYEADLALRVGAAAAHDARREMAAHLEADFAARREAGLSAPAAYHQSLAAIGSLDAAAREERVDPLRLWAAAGLQAAALLMTGSWSVNRLNEGAPRLIVTLLAAVSLGWAATTALRSGNGRGRGRFAEYGLSLLPSLLTFGAYAPGRGFAPWAGGCIVAAMVVSVILALALGIRQRVVAWTTGLFAGTAIFLVQTMGVIVSLQGTGAKPGYPLDVTIGTWMAFTLPILLLSGLGAGIANLVTRTRSGSYGAVAS